MIYSKIYYQFLQVLQNVNFLFITKVEQIKAVDCSKVSNQAELSWYSFRN